MTPPTAPSLRIVPLGGLGEIGMNCMAIEIGADILVVDCGVTFPRSDLGIDTFHPDFTWLEDRADRVRGLVITHGHEDHIGAIPYFADRFDVPIWGPPYALELARARLAEAGFRQGSVRLVNSKPGQRFEVGGFEVEPVRVTHSIADATALIIRTAAGTIVHTGDFKLDESPLDGEKTDEARFAEVGREGVRLLLSDSTNIDSHGRSGSESLAAETLEPLVRSAEGRVIVGLFASNVQRLGALAGIAQRTKRRLLLLGRSAQTHARIGRELGRLSFPVELLARYEDANSLPRREVLAVATGTQAERNAALSRLATRVHPALTLDRGDRVIFSSRIIPGNEPAVSWMVNGLLRQGIDVRSTITDPGVHVSGHAYRDEQSRMIDLVMPRGFVPVHGTLHHLHRHAALARSRGVEVGDVGATLRKSKELAPFAKIPTWAGEAIPPGVLADREAMARAGIAFVTVLVDGQGRSAGPARVSTRGVLDEKLDGAVLAEAAREVVQALDRRPATRERPTDEELADIARLAARKRLEIAARKKPVVLAMIIRVKA